MNKTKGPIDQIYTTEMEPQLEGFPDKIKEYFKETFYMGATIMLKLVKDAHEENDQKKVKDAINELSEFASKMVSEVGE